MSSIFSGTSGAGVHGGENGISKDYTISQVEEFNTAEYLSWRRLYLSKSKLNNVVEMASFMAGFAVVGTVELQINDQDASPPLLAAFVITTSLLVGTCMTAIIIATCILPHMEAVAKTSRISGANQSPHDKMMRLIDISWILTNSASLFFFTLDIILMSWIKYTFFTRWASIAATIIMAPVLVVIIVFGFLFYRRIVKHQYVIASLKYEELERLHEKLQRTASLNSSCYHGFHMGHSEKKMKTPPSPFDYDKWLRQNHYQHSLYQGGQGSPKRQKSYNYNYNPSPKFSGTRHQRCNRSSNDNHFHSSRMKSSTISGASTPTRKPTSPSWSENSFPPGVFTA